MKVLVVRFSSLGDVALCQPALLGALKANPEIQIDLLTRPRFKPLFEGYDRLHVLDRDVDKEFAGILGLYRLFLSLPDYELVIDLHQNLRTSVLKFLFRLKGIRSFTYYKGRKEKKALLGHATKPIRHTVDRYADCFAKAGIAVRMPDPPVLGNFLHEEEKIDLFLNEAFPEQRPFIGIAPFAQFKWKQWPYERIASLAQKLNHAGYNILLFGGGAQEVKRLEEIELPGIVSVAGKFSLTMELSLMRKLSVMVCMDSGNLHLSALSGVPVVSIWGPTHPFLGFSPWKQTDQAAVVQTKLELGCRPCSVFGHLDCQRGDHACMQSISEDEVFEAVLAQAQIKK